MIGQVRLSITDIFSQLFSIMIIIYIAIIKQNFNYFRICIKVKEFLTYEFRFSEIASE